MSRLLFTLAGVALFASAPFAAAEDAAFVKLVNPDTGKVLAVENDSDAGAGVVAAKDTGGTAQQWKVEKDGEFLKITNRKSGKALDVFQNGTAEGDAIIVWDEKADDNDNQRWSWTGDAKDKARRLKSKSSSLVLDVGDDGKVVQKKADDKGKSQLWEVVAVKK